MIFNEIYSAYYNAVAKIIANLVSGNTDEKVMPSSEENGITCHGCT